MAWSGIGSRNKGAMAPLKFKPLHRNVIFAIENHLSLAKWPFLTFSSFLHQYGEACNEKIGPPPKLFCLDEFWQPKLACLPVSVPPLKI